MTMVMTKMMSGINIYDKEMRMMDLVELVVVVGFVIRMMHSSHLTGAAFNPISLHRNTISSCPLHLQPTLTVAVFTMHMTC